MNYIELENLAAEKIMGWERIKTPFLNGWIGNGDLIDNYKWTPCTNITQAFDILEELCGANVPLTDRRWFTVGPKICELVNAKGDVAIREFGDNPSHAIVKACLVAKGVYEDLV